MEKKSILLISHQVWKYRMFNICLNIGMFILFGALFFYPPPDSKFIEFIEISVAISFLGFGIGLTIKCPRCNCRWVWIAFNQKLKSNAVVKLKSLDKCPKCGFSENDLV